MHYSIVGHFAKDILPGGGYQLGGAVYYSGVQAARLGAQVSVISSAGNDIDLSQQEPGITAYVEPAPQSTTFENIYDSEGRRTQYVRGQALPLRPENAPALNPPPDVVQLAPLVGEVSLDYAKAYPNAKICVAPQGWMRHIGSDGLVTPKQWTEAEKLLPSAWACVFSEEDLGYDSIQIDKMGMLCRISVCTRNYSGATLFVDGKEIHVPAVQANVVDPTGAGDVFAAAFFVRLYETNDPVAAVQFAHVAAARSIEARGVSDVCRREEILELMASG